MAELNAKHRKVLSLLKTNQLSLEQIAEKAGYSFETLTNLLEGKGDIGKLFLCELQKVDHFVEKRTNRRIIRTRELLYKRLNGWAKAIANHKELSRDKHKQLVDSLNALSRAYPQIKVENYTWNMGMSQQELMNELKRLATTARGSFIRGRPKPPAVEIPQVD